jgi:thioesterase domain-containing protein
LPLALQLDPSLPVIGLQTLSADGSAAAHLSVPAAARAHVATLRRHQPNGPYRLLGHSYGGWIAYEMARQLEMDGQWLAPLVLVDSESPRPGRKRDVESVIREYVTLIDMRRPAPLKLDDAVFARASDTQRIDSLLKHLIGAGVLTRTTSPALFRAAFHTFLCNYETGYQPESHYSGRVVLVHADAAPHDAMKRVSAWSRWSTQLSHHCLRGSNHMTLLDAPFVAHLAAIVESVSDGSIVSVPEIHSRLRVQP